MKKRSNTEKIGIIVAVISITAALLCFGYVGIYYYKGAEFTKNNSRVVEEVSQYFFNDDLKKEDDSIRDSGDIAVKSGLDEEIQAGIEKLQKYNKDSVGWLLIEGTDISYPVVQCQDNEYYLSHNFNGETDKHGCLFLDYRNDLGEDDASQAYIIYGHNMKDGTQFGGLKKFYDEEYRKEHRVAHFYTNKGDKQYELYDVITWKPGDDNVYDITFEPTRLVLSTCTSNNRRQILVFRAVNE